MFWNRDIKNIGVSDQKKSHEQDSSVNKRRTFKRSNGFDTASYQKVENLAQKFMMDSSLKGRVRRKMQKAQEKTNAHQTGSFTGMDYKRISNLGSLEGINSNRQQIQEIKLSHFNIEVEDADTIILQNKLSPGSKKISIRMAGIDAPEVSHGQDDPFVQKYKINQNQPLGGAATSRLKDLVNKAGNLRLVVDPTQKTYGRYLGVLMDGNKNINLDLVKSGHVSALEFGTSKKSMINMSEFNKEGTLAENSQTGIWKDPFFKNWKAFSEGAGGDITFNTLTEKIKLADNKALAVGAGYIWSGQENMTQSYQLGKAYKEIKEGQKLSKERMKANKSFNPQSRREDQGTIEGMLHGWFGRQRQAATPFGSPYRVGAEHREALMDAKAIDIETRSLKSFHGSVIQASILTSGNEIEEVNVFQKDKKYKTDFIKKHTLKHMGSDRFAKEASRHTLYDPTYGVYHSETVPMNQAMNRVNELLSEGRRSSLLIHNANFEWNQLSNYVGGSGSFSFSEGYQEARQGRYKKLVEDKKLLNNGAINAGEFAQRKINNQMDVFGVVLHDIKNKKHIVDTQEIAKTLNAVAQDKNLIAKTGKIEISSNLDFLSRTLLGRTTETHVSGFDAKDTKIAANKMLSMIEKIQKGYNNWNKGELAWLTEFGAGKGSTQATKMAAQERMILTSEKKKMADNPLMFDKKISKTEMMLGDSGINYSNIVDEARATFKNTEKVQSTVASNIVHPNNHMPNRGQVNKGALVLGGIALAAATISSLGSMNMFSGRDDDANTIEGLRHGWYGDQRNDNAPFGSGYRTMQQHHTDKAQETYDPIAPAYLAMGGIGGAGIFLSSQWNQTTKTKLSELGHLGQLHETMSNEKLLGREFATVGEVLTASIKRAESSMGGIFRVFGISDQMSLAITKNIELTQDLLQSNSSEQIKLIHKLSGRNLAEEGITSIKLKENKLWAFDQKTQKYSDQIPGFYHAAVVRPNKDISKAPSQFISSVLSTNNLGGADKLEQNLLIIGGENSFKATTNVINAYGHESLVKGMKVLDEPLGALQEMFPNLKENKTLQKIRDSLSLVPGLGTGGDYSGGVSDVVKKHGKRLLGAAGILGIGYGTIDWLTRNAAPEDSMIGSAGLMGVGAEAVKAAHMTYAYASEASGLTALRSGIDESSGGNGWGTALGFTLSGMLGGATLATVGNLSSEINATDRYDQFKQNRAKTQKIDTKLKIGKLDLELNKIPGLGGESSFVGKYAKVGAVAGLALSLPFLLSGLGSSQSVDDWKKEYSGEKLVGVKKGRYWEGSMTPWEGGATAYYRPGWYAKMKDDPRKKVLHGDEDLSPMGSAIRSLWDPYRLEKRNFENSPYPFTGPDGSSMGMFGPLYEATLGRALKAPVFFNKEETEREYLNGADKYPVSEALGGLPKGLPRDPSSFTALGRDMVRTVTEGLGLRSFAASSMLGAMTGESNIDQYTPEYASASGLDSLNSKFYDMQLGGGGLTTEAIRRLFPKETQGETDYVNPLKNAMPSWLPGDNSKYHMNFQRGDSYTKIKDGYYRLPGEGYTSRYEELEGMDPEDYPDIFKYEILADVAPFSKEFKSLRGRLQNKALDKGESKMFERIETQLSEKNKSKETFRDPDVYNNPLGLYTSILTDTIRRNPAEQLLPFSPARKFLPAIDPIDRYKETVYGKDFQDWKDPVGDFIMPAMNMTRDLVGMASVPEEVEYARETEDYYDQVKYVKAKKLAAEAAAKGDASSQSYYRGQADRTMAGLDPYMDSNEILGRISKRDRPYFQDFVEATGSKRDQVRKLSSKRMNEIYEAQWDKQDSLRSGDTEGLYQRADKKRMQRRERLQSFEAPNSGWVGWNKEVDLEDVKMQQLVNEGRDYHYHGLWQDRLNLLARKPYIQEAAAGVKQGSTQLDDYLSAANDAAGMQLVGGRISVMPGIDSSYNVEMNVDRYEEKKRKLHELGYL